MRIWLIDDDEMEHILVEGILKSLPQAHCLNFFSKIETSLQTLHTLQADQIPDLILLDLALPIHDGFDFLDHFQNENLSLIYPQTQIYILTSSQDRQERSKAQAYPCVKGVILKPLLLIQLQTLLLSLEKQASEQLALLAQ
ncbi:hypothetical protein COW36_03215 [bacterium (Candidatus Blackallbacteria) CG17_big_fil_post_rev_8_21_14_2_50_48_46]|uniref:Response regulatory domain-containing protein n=1 Tax=bacterium (Candidatus Blackallbacteria) CG17_big_fil_post_rev_8_21_14_2_50_48_46 TaxID=2014261 RepID=A0A2M7G9S0_9BACT|nr:MAG: hypothetical protein COW64_08720 [bacterium (Candidatus Blackallbacteria) CG18_big_fil_WC_8_21_14_2_50_49_26]PIW18866.1 MAG: hypothetical protein COW36_03215 [bacterium (Candidatus Blackallbacteria) CG17_big_fil_post_rev_8_21_14_2_50_48_46]PIW44857.1 MAG: hypothetical protein COW20_22610 [bacterium (Candidatus Blackallbacteria) CG13_big_fil_rev_8_21_14_2_50_49_14]